MGTRNGAARAANGAGKGVALLEDGGLRTKAEVQGSAGECKGAVGYREKSRLE